MMKQLCGIYAEGPIEQWM